MKIEWRKGHFVLLRRVYQVCDDWTHWNENFIEDGDDVVSSDFRDVIEGLAGVVTHTTVAVSHAGQDWSYEVFRIPSGLLDLKMFFWNFQISLPRLGNRQG